MSYLLASKSCMVDLATGRMIRLTEKTAPEQIIVPCYFFKKAASRGMMLLKDAFEGAPKYNSIAIYSECVDLPGMTLQFVGSSGYGKCTQSYLKFQDTLTHSLSELHMTLSLNNAFVVNSAGHRLPRLGGVCYDMFFNGHSANITVNFNPVAFNVPRFKRLSNLGRGMFEIGIDEFFLGLRKKKFKIICRGNDTGVERYALMLGPWAIVLSDELTLEAIVLLSGVDTQTLYVDRFIYNMNGAFVKYAMLAR